MIISDFTIPELEYYRERCNFVGNEVGVFEMRSRGTSIEAIAEALNLSVDGAKKISRKVNRKIIKVGTLIGH